MEIPDRLKKEKFAYLTTKGRKTGKNHEVELWFALANDRIYLSHEGEFTDWMKNLTKNSTVSLKIGPENFQGEAVLTQMGSENREAGKQALYEKYYGPATKETLDDWFELSTVIEIAPK
jgi:hypothetical protein